MTWSSHPLASKVVLTWPLLSPHKERQESRLLFALKESCDKVARPLSLSSRRALIRSLFLSRKDGVNKVAISWPEGERQQVSPSSDPQRESVDRDARPLAPRKALTRSPSEGQHRQGRCPLTPRMASTRLLYFALEDSVDKAVVLCHHGELW